MIPFSILTSSPNISTDLIWLHEKINTIKIDETDELDETDFWMLITSPGGILIFVFATYIVKEWKISYNFTFFLGFYRVNYSERNWLALLNAIRRKEDVFHERSRAVLADDAFSLARFGHLDYAIVFKLISCWKHYESKYLPWKMVLDNLEYVYDNSYDLTSFRNLRVKFI